MNTKNCKQHVFVVSSLDCSVELMSVFLCSV